MPGSMTALHSDGVSEHRSRRASQRNDCANGPSAVMHQSFCFEAGGLTLTQNSAAAYVPGAANGCLVANDRRPIACSQPSIVATTWRQRPFRPSGYRQRYHEP